MEFGNFNESAITNWVSYFGPQLRRIILSNQLPLAEIKKLNVKAEIEIQGCGRIELFYSPRQLVHGHLSQEADAISLSCASADRPTQISPLIENSSGTFMFYDKDLFILDELRDDDISPNYIRLELYHPSQYEMLLQHYPKPGWQKKLEGTLSTKTTRGFFRINKSHAPLQRLTNKHLKKESETKIGVILESIKKQHMVTEIQKEITLPARIMFCSPEGKQVEYMIQNAENLAGKIMERKILPGFYKLPWIKHVVPASILKIC